MFINAPFATYCKSCKLVVKKGSRIYWDKQNNIIEHETCSNDYKQSQQEQTEISENLRTSFAIDSNIDIPCPSNISYLPYQRGGIAYTLARKGKTRGCLIGDEMGLGKTIEAIGFMNASPEYRTILILCPKSLKLNWYAELEKWYLYFEKPTYRIHINTYSNLSKLAGRGWDLVILDEAHFIKNPESQRSQEVKRICTYAQFRLLLTGTPIPNRPVELWPTLQIVDPERWDPPGYHDGKQVTIGSNAGYHKFTLRYCDAKLKVTGKYFNPYTKQFEVQKSWDVKGASNLEELQTRLRGTIMVRRLKKDVLTELPPKRRQILLLPTESTEDGEVVNNFNAEDWPNDLAECVQIINEGSKISFKDFSTERHRIAINKVEDAIHHIKGLYLYINKLVVFGHHLDVIDALYQSLKEFNPRIIIGETKEFDRQQAVTDFQTNENVKLFIGSITAAGTGITLTAASHMLFVESSYAPYEVNQAEDRIHRKGQYDKVLIQHLLRNNTLDAHLLKLLVKKQEIIDATLD
jgi:SWI/SNF-related matrix-associated actin-dependent regulator 1 of chromatin subfamily A